MWMLIVSVIAISSRAIWPDCERHIKGRMLARQIEHGNFIVKKDGRVFVDVDKLDVSVQGVRGTGSGTLAAQSVLNLLQRNGVQDDVRGIAILALGRLGADAKEALPDLDALLSDPFFNVAAASAIYRIESDMDTRKKSE